MSRSRDFGAAAGSLAAPSSANNGYSYVVDTTQSSSWNYSPLNSAGRNILINGGFDFWQRLAAPGSVATYSAGVYSADRWSPMQYQSCRANRAANSYSTPGPISQYVMQVSSLSDTGGSRLQITQKVESLNTYPLRGKQVTLSFWIKFSSATFASTSNTTNSSYGDFYCGVFNFTSTTDGITSTTGGDGQTSIINISNGSLPTVWTKYSVTGTVPTNANNIVALFSFSALGSTATNDVYNYQIGDVQLEQGPVATPFTKAGGNYGAEFQLCQRYFEKSYDINVAPGTNDSNGAVFIGGASDSSSNQQVPITFKVPKRNNSYTVTKYTSAGVAGSWLYARSGASGSGVAQVDVQGTNGFRLYVPVGAAWTPSYVYGHWVADGEL